MQLKKNPSIHAALATATCAVLSQPAAAAAPTGDEWVIDSALLFYAEQDRVSVVEPTLSAQKELGDDELLTLRTALDTVSGASPNGATPSNTVQSFTSPSGKSTVTVAPGETPMFDFRDLRGSLSADWRKSYTRTLHNTVGASISGETDYLSLGVSDTLSKELNQRMTTLEGGIAFTFDTIKPVGGAPDPLSLYSSPGPETDSDTRQTSELLLGVTQVLSRKTLAQFNLGFSHSSGYHNDPYKLLSVVDGATGETLDYRFESRPDSRSSQTLYGKLVHHFDEDVVHLSYRYFTDDWGIDSHTVDLHYRYELGHERYLQPHIRYYSQSAADFFHYSLIDGEPVPEYASADLRLGEMTGTTIGLRYAMPVGEGKWKGELSFRVEQMVQEGESHPAEAIGIQQNYDLYPTLNATIVQVGYSFRY